MLSCVEICMSVVNGMSDNLPYISKGNSGSNSLLRTTSNRCRIVVTTACRPTMKGKSPLIKCRHLCLQEQASQQKQSNPTPWLHDVQIMVWEGCSTAWQGGDQTTPPCRYVWGPEKDLNSQACWTDAAWLKILKHWTDNGNTYVGCTDYRGESQV